ncbi:MAG: rhodanese-like domain-containing protein [Rickettsiaceae bacterium]|nr:rhodanese-like domain-containing protein [Rickettsiaceae bacterium]
MKTITPLEAKQLLNTVDNIFLVDVRTSQEWSEDGVPIIQEESRFLPLSIYLGPDRRFNQSFVSDFISICPDKNATVIFMCKSGYRSSKALELISNQGYGYCINMLGGFEEWRSSNLPHKQKK